MLIKLEVKSAKFGWVEMQLLHLLNDSNFLVYMEFLLDLDYFSGHRQTYTVWNTAFRIDHKR